MTARPRIIDFLRTTGNAAADFALVAALPRVAPELQSELLEILLTRGEDAGLAELPALYDQLTEEAQHRIVSRASRLFGALRTSIRSPRVQTRTNTIRIVGLSGNPRLAYLAQLALSDGSPLVRSDGALVLRQLTDRHCQTFDETVTNLRCASGPEDEVVRAIAGTISLLREERRFLTTALVEALTSFENHHRMEAVEAAMYMADSIENELPEDGSSRRTKLTHAMLEIFTRSMSPRLAGFAYIAMRHKELRARVVSSISSCRSTPFFIEFIKHHYLGRDPRVSRHLALIRSLSWLADGSQPFSLPPPVAALLPAWLMPLGLPAAEKVALLRKVLLLDNPAAHRAAVWALVNTPSAASTRALEAVLDHDDASLRRMAEREVQARKTPARRTHGRLRPDRPAVWASFLATAHLTEDFADLWNHFDRLDPALTREAGAHAIEFVKGFTAQIRTRLTARHPQDRIRAIRLLAALGVCRDFDGELFSTASDGHAEVRTAAMGALSHIGDATSRRILERGLHDESPDVQAAAIDGLDRMNADRRAESIAPKAVSESPQVRAAAIRALLRARSTAGATNLVYMLNDPRAAHRVEALWLAERLHLGTLVPRILEIAESDPDPGVVRIANHVLRRLERQGPMSAAEPMQEVE